MSPEYFFPMLGVVFVLGLTALRTVRFMASTRTRLDRGGGMAGEDTARVAALEARVLELEERVDFTERLLARGGGDRQEG